MNVTADFELPWCAQPAQRAIVAVALRKYLEHQIMIEGATKQVERFLEQYSSAPEEYAAEVATRFGANVPPSVQGILDALTERLAELSQRHQTAQFDGLISWLDRFDLATKMAVTETEVRALNDILGH